MKALGILSLVFSFLMYHCSSMKSYKTDQKQFIEIIDTMFVAMQNADTLQLQKIFKNPVQFATLNYISNKNGELEIAKLDDFFTSLQYLKKNKIQWKEVIHDYKIEQDLGYASVWTPYSFYLEDKLIHCGINHFQLIKSNEKWQIAAILDTRRKNCKK